MDSVCMDLRIGPLLTRIIFIPKLLPSSHSFSLLLVSLVSSIVPGSGVIEATWPHPLPKNTLYRQQRQ